MTVSSFGYSYSKEPVIDPGILLFMIERSRDPDYLVYLLRTDTNGKMDEGAPVEVYWVKKTKNNLIEPLTRIQKRYGYGIEFVDEQAVAENEWLFRIAAFPEQIFILKQDADRNYRVYIQGTGGEIEVRRVFVNFSNNSFWNPEVSDVTLYGLEPGTGASYSQTIIAE